MLKNIQFGSLSSNSKKSYGGEIDQSLLLPNYTYYPVNQGEYELWRKFNEYLIYYTPYL